MRMGAARPRPRAQALGPRERGRTGLEVVVDAELVV
jgi:hypothetical protein